MPVPIIVATLELSFGVPPPEGARRMRLAALHVVTVVYSSFFEYSRVLLNDHKIVQLTGALGGFRQKVS